MRNADGSLRERWRLVPDGAGLTLQWLEKGVWRSTTSWRQTTKPLSFSDATLGKVRVVMPDGTQRDYRRTVRTVRSGTGLMTLSVLSMQYYLQSVVPSEMPPSWSPAALQAQAVAARTFAAYQTAHQPAGTPYDTCDSTSCQVYKGLAGYSSSGTQTPFEYTATTAAVSATNGLGVFYGGALALTQFSSSNGGQTVASSLPYQVSKADPYDAVPSGSSSRWTTTLSISKIEKAYPTTGTLRSLRIDARDGINAWNGRITSLTVIGSAGTKTVTGDAFRTAMGLRSTWWTVTSAPATSVASFPKDLDGNERADLLAVDGSGQLRLLSGNGASAFTAKTVASGWGGLGLVANVGSWDGDNRHDVVERDAGTLYYHPGNGKGGLFPRVRISDNWDTINLVTGSGDVDRDGHTDFMVRTTSGQLKVYRGDGKGGVVSTIYLSSGWNAYRVIVAPGDLTGDGRTDVLAIRSTDEALLLFPGLGTGKVGAGVAVAGSWAGYTDLMGSGDVTGDSRDDVVARRGLGRRARRLHRQRHGRADARQPSCRGPPPGARGPAGRRDRLSVRSRSTVNGAPVASRTCSSVTSGASSRSTRPSVGHVEHGEVGDDPLHHGLAGERQAALLDDLVRAVLGDVLHEHDDLLRAVDEVHRATHPLDHLPGDHPVGDVAGRGDLHRAEDRGVDLPAADHPERRGRVEVRRAPAHGDGLLAGVDEVGVDGVVGGVGADAEDAVLRLQDDLDVVGHVVGHEGRQADAEVDVGAVLELGGGPGGHLLTGQRHGSGLLGRVGAGVTVRRSMRLSAACSGVSGRTRCT